jgi:hypothetical protein
VQARTGVSDGVATASAAPSASSWPPRPEASSPRSHETVERPEPGLARGRFEAPAWFFYAVLAAAILGMVAWAVTARVRRRHP